MSHVALLLLRIYRNILSPLLLPSCKFLPTCSVYAEQAITRHGVLRGGWLTMRRLLRCHPFSHSAVDLVP
jgi:hypothetical protein